MINVDALAKILWDYNHLDHKLEKADIIVALGSHDLRVAERAAQLFLEGWAPLIVFSGGFGRLTGGWTRPEAEMFAEVAERLGVPRSKMLLESKSTNTGENIEFTKTLLTEKAMDVSTLILVHKPYMERRAYATFQKRWPEKKAILSSPLVSYEDYPNDYKSKEEVINVLVGDTQRNKLYGEKGFIVPQTVPKDVWEAFEKLVEMGYVSHLVKD